MFSPDFYPTNKPNYDTLVNGLELQGKVVLEPQAGTGNIVKWLQDDGSRVIACELHDELRKILQTKCEIIGSDFLKVTSEQISHVDFIIMNPPFSDAARHIAHAFKIAPAGCKIRSLCNSETLKNAYSKSREEVVELVKAYGSSQELGKSFATAERKTDVDVTLIRLDKPGEAKNEFEGFFMDEEPAEAGSYGIMSYNIVRDLVNRYVKACQIFDEQLKTAVQLSEMTDGFYGGKWGMQVTRNNEPLERNTFRKGMQKSGWKWILRKLNMEKHATKGLKEDINKFVEAQYGIPFTMKNIYRMLEIIIATTGQRMDKAVLEVFDRITGYHHDNRQGIPGWKTNSHYLLTRRFIMPDLSRSHYSGGVGATHSYQNFEMISDLMKALCYLTGEDYDKKETLDHFMDRRFFLMKGGEYLRYESGGKISDSSKYQLEYKLSNYPGAEIVHEVIEWGKWFEWEFFKIRCYKKGTVHFEFKEEKVWATFNQCVAKLKGYPLPEKKSETAYQARQNGHKPTPKAKATTPVQKVKPVVLSTIKIGG